ncbi:pyridoxamine 5'-phosphate oxidase family protein [Kitasatospora sp. NPDC094011]|uniref:pyridoxamine 5'-phosphate oxidase family protein n=1 Tax=Kitasatospora sp. NPDC094011 TaxID=3364090 RepID=UPI0037F63D5A
MIFTETERAYLAGQLPARLATIGPDGAPQVRPVGFRLNADGTIDIGGPAMARSRKYRNAQARPEVSVLAVEVPPVAPGRFSNDIIRVHPRRIITWNLEALGSRARDAG